jgi:uncharacterized protein
MTLTFGIIVTLILIGFFAGVLSGLVGVGGGIIIVPCLVFFLAFTQKMAQGTSLALLTLPVVILGMLQYYKQGHVDFKIVIFLALGFIIGGFFGGKLAVSLPEKSLKRIFSILLFIVATKKQKLKFLLPLLKSNFICNNITMHLSP